MKTRILLIAAALFCMFNVNAQTNLGFETWGPSTYSANDPTGWGTLSLDGFGGPASTFKETISPGAGTASARMVTTTGYAPLIGPSNDTLPGMVTIGGPLFDGNLGIPYTQKPTSIDFMYKSDIMVGDTGFFVAQLTHWDGTQSIFDGFASVSFTSPAVNAWTPVNIPFTYLTSDTPDTLQIIGVSSQSLFFVTPMPLPGSELQLDDIVINTGVQPCNTPTAAFTSTTSNLFAAFTNGSSTTGNVVYSWDFGDGSGTSSQQNPNYAYGSGGTYNVCLTVTDSCGTNQTCQNVTVTAPVCNTPIAAFTSSASGLAVTFTNGSSTTGSVVYSWNFGDGFGTSSQQNPNYTYGTGGTFNVCLTVTDSCGANQSCQNVTVSGGCTLVATTTATDESSAGANDGTGTAFASGGTAPYTYLWSDPSSQTTAIATGLSPGSYTVIVMDAAGCVATGTIVVQAGTGCNLVVTVTSTDESSLGANDGTGTAIASGGTTPYTYIWDDFFGQTTATATGLSPGVYNVLVIDASGCQATGAIVVQAAGCNLSVTTSSTDETSAGANDGTGTVSVSGGTAPFNYTWSDPSAQTNTTATNLAPGTYTVIVLDFLGCSTIGTVVIQPGSGGCVMVVATTSTAESSAGASDGTATAIVANGTTPYTYLWTPSGQTGSIATGLSPGTYTVAVTDAAGCQTTSTVVVAAAGGCNLIVVATATNETTAGSGDGTGAASASNGTTPYSYLWSDGQTSALATGLVPGTYTVTATDSAGCTAITSVTVQPGACQFQVNITVIDETTMGGNNGSAAAIVANGTGPYNYQWSTGATTSSITGLAPGVYSCTVIDANACSSGGTGVVQNFQCTLTASMSSTDESSLGAFDGTAIVSPSGGTAPYTYAWSTFETTSAISNLGVGIYDVTVTDASGCTYMASAAVNPGGVGCNLVATVSGTGESQAGVNDGTATVAISGGTAPIFITWDNLDTSSTIFNLAPGDYTVVIQDALGCFATATYTVAPGLIIGVPEQITPVVSVKVYPNPAVDMINFEINGADQGVLYVFDFAGRQVKEVSISESLTEINTEDLGNGMYFYQLMGTKSNKLGSGKFVIFK